MGVGCWPSGSCQNVVVGLAVGNLRGVCLIPDGVHQQGRRPTVSRLFPYGLDRFVLRFQFGSSQQFSSSNVPALIRSVSAHQSAAHRSAWVSTSMLARSFSTEVSSVGSGALESFTKKVGSLVA